MSPIADNQVLKEWENFEFQWITNSVQYPAVLNFLHHNFFYSTPLTQGLEKSDEYVEEFDKIYLTVLPQNMSFAVINKDTNEIAGLRITYVQNRELEQTFKDFGFRTNQMKIMNKIMGTVNHNSRIYERYGIDSFVNFYTACVDPKCRGLGIATKMYEVGLDALRLNPKHKYVKSNLTSPYTRKICNKFGFKELARAYYNDFKNEDGIPLLNGRKDEEYVAFMVLKLK